MATIIIRDIPEKLMEEIRRAATLDRRSVPAEILHLTEIGLRQTSLPRQEHTHVVMSMRRRLAERSRFPVTATALTDKDRQR